MARKKKGNGRLTAKGRLKLSSTQIVAVVFAGIILLGAMGGLYEKQRSIWGVALIHYVLGQAAACLGFLA